MRSTLLQERYKVPIHSWWSYNPDGPHTEMNHIPCVVLVQGWGGSSEQASYSLEITCFTPRFWDTDPPNEIPEELRRINVKRFWDLVDGGKLRRIDA